MAVRQETVRPYDTYSLCLHAFISSVVLFSAVM